MTSVPDLILAELSSGPKSLVYLDRKCGLKALPWLNPSYDTERTIRMMIEDGTIREAGCQYEDGIFAPVYEAII